MSERPVLIVGGGLLGCASALEFARRGVAVTVLERAVAGAEASSAAGGILAPRYEAHGEEPLRGMGIESLGMYPRRVAEVEKLGGIPTDLRHSGLLRPVLAGESPEATRPDHEAEWVTRGDLSEIEPALTPEALGAWRLPEAKVVDPRRLVAAVHAAARAAGAAVQSGREVTAVDRDGVELADGARLEGRVLVCAGAWTGRVPGLPAVPVRPVRGQMVALRPAQALSHVVFGPHGYLVPRVDGRLLAGSTEESVGFARAVTAGGLARVLAGSLALMPGLADAPVVETWCGFRPGTPDGLPVLGVHDGVWIASGHFRNGILLAPVTARWMADAMLDRRALPPAVSPARFGPS